MYFRTFDLYEDMARQPHLLIAGATGSGKSVVENGIIFQILLESPMEHELILIDPKRVELFQYKDCPHVIRYESEPMEMVTALYHAVSIMEKRYEQMREQRKRKYEGSHVYVIIDELGDLMNTQGRRVAPVLQRLTQLGRAARVHVIACTQNATTKVIPSTIRDNFCSIVGLHTRDKNASRIIIGRSGCEDLPRYGEGWYITPEGEDRWQIPMYEDSEIENLVDHWRRLTA